MSIRVMTKVFSHSESKLAGRLVLLALADAASDDGIAWVGQTALAAKARIAEATVRSCLRDLEAAGEVQTRKAKRGRSRINVYRVMMPGVAAPEYDRLPFVLEAPFDDRGNPAVVDDDRGFTSATTAGLRPSSRARVKAGTESPVEPREANASPGGGLHDPPRTKMIDGQNVGYNALAEVCQIRLDDLNRRGEIAAALNGSRGSRGRPLVEVGIRQLAWSELVEAHFGGDDAAAAAVVSENPDRFENALVVLVRRRAQQYRETMSGALLTPTALAKWWLTLESLAATRRDGGLTPEQMEAQGG